MSMSSPRQRSTPQKPQDPIVGLDVCGKLFYCHQSTLTQISPYFARRFAGRFNADVSYTDERSGRQVYFVERDPEAFTYIFKYMITPDATRSTTHMPDFDKDPALYRRIREDAEYFGLLGLVDLLQTTRSFTPTETHRGVLYWLGTHKGKAATYQNPYTLGAIHVGGWIDDAAENQHKAMFELARSATCRANFVQYQLPVSLRNSGGGGGNSGRQSIESYNYLLWCDHGMERLPVTLDLKSILLRPTHYSLRVSQCYGMQGDWNFEGSLDNLIWDVLHSARGDDRLCLSESSDIITKLDKAFPSTSNNQQRSEALLRLIEQDYRHTWELTPAPEKFYKYFRIIGAGSVDDIRDNCLHGEGIELFGDVYEE